MQEERGFSLVAVGTSTLAIGLDTALFSLTYGALVRACPSPTRSVWSRSGPSSRERVWRGSFAEAPRPVLYFDSRGRSWTDWEVYLVVRAHRPDILGTLVKARLLRSVRGARCGVLLARPAEEISLLAVVEACQGMLVGDYCRSIDAPGPEICAFHQAMADVHRATVAALSRWTLADLLAAPVGDRPAAGPPCKMRFEGWARHRGPAPEAP